MKIKYNFGLLKNLDIGFKNKESSFHGILKDVKKIDKKYRFFFEGKYIEIDESSMYLFKMERENEIVWFVQVEKPIVSGLGVFSMFDTYGFPIEMTKEIMEEKGYDIDENGFYLLREIQKEKTKNTFKNKNAF